MDPQLAATLQSIASVAVPAIVTFLVGHFHIVLPNPLTPSGPTPVTPVTPTTPATPATPAVRPIGQGGLIDILSQALQSILLSPKGTPADKAKAAQAVVEATQPFLAA